MYSKTYREQTSPLGEHVNLLCEVLRDLARPKIVDLGGGVLINLNLITTIDLDRCPGGGPEEVRARIKLVGSDSLFLTIESTERLMRELGLDAE